MRAVLLAALLAAGCSDPRPPAPSASGPPASGPLDSRTPPGSAAHAGLPPSAPAAQTATAAASSLGGAPAAGDPVKLAFVGDVAFNYSIASDLERLARAAPPGAQPGDAGAKAAGIEPGFPFAGVADRLRAADLAIANLECVVSKLGEVSTWHKPFRGPLPSIDALLSAGIDVVSVANNHSWDYGREGFFDMLKNLDEKKLPVMGKSFRHEAPREPERAVVLEVRGTKVGFLGYYFADDRALARDVAAATKEADLVVAYFHWGREKQVEVTPEQRRQARVAIDAGASLVVGSHVHVVQPTEVYRGKLIAYGLGNFVFMGMNHEERFRKGALLEVSLTKDELRSFELVPTRIDDRGSPRVVIPESSYLPKRDK